MKIFFVNFTMTPPPLSILYEKFIAKICIFLRFWGFFGANVSKDETRILLLRLVCAAQRAAEKIQNTIRTVGFAKAFCLFAGKNAPKVCGLYLARQTHAPTKNLDRYAVFYGTACPFDNDNMRATAAKVCVWGGTAGQKRRKKCDADSKTQPCAAFEDKGFTRLQQKNVSPRPFV